jgi:hypothetical protein
MRPAPSRCWDGRGLGVAPIFHEIRHACLSVQCAFPRSVFFTIGICYWIAASGRRSFQGLLQEPGDTGKPLAEI